MYQRRISLQRLPNRQTKFILIFTRKAINKNVIIVYIQGLIGLNFKNKQIFNNIDIMNLIIKNKEKYNMKQFPEGFLWGGATAAN